MRIFIGVCFAIAVAVGQLFADANSATLAPSYEVNQASVAPVIDGVVDVGEWDTAAEAAGGFVNLKAHTPVDRNLRFQAMWDDENLYILGLSDYDGFVNAVDHGAAIPADPDSTSELFDAPDNPDWVGGGYSMNFYIDPNTDGERVWTGTDDMDGESVPNDVVDGYQIAWDVFEGFAARRPTAGADEQSFRDPLDEVGNQINDYYGGFYLEAHVNETVENQGLWDQDNSGPNGNYRDDSHPGLVFAQNASNDDVNVTGAAGMVSEWAIAWSALNATNPNKLVTQEEADARGPEMILDEREFIEIPDPDFPGGTIEISNPDFNMLVPNVGQIFGIAAFIGNVGEPDLRFSDPESAVFLDNGLYVESAPSDGDVWALEIGAITNDLENALPSWSEPLDGDPGRTAFPEWKGTEHGRLVFVGGSDNILCDPNTGGDLDGNGKVEFADFLVVSGNFGNDVASHAEGDVDCNMNVGFSDFLVVSGNFGKDLGDVPCDPNTGGDVDANGKVEFADFLVMSGNFGKNVADHSEGDIDCDGQVGFSDFLILSGNFGKDVGGAQSVPEPTGLALLSMAGLVCGELRRRRS